MFCCIGRWHGKWLLHLHTADAVLQADEDIRRRIVRRRREEQPEGVLQGHPHSLDACPSRGQPGRSSTPLSSRGIRSSNFSIRTKQENQQSVKSSPAGRWLGKTQDACLPRSCRHLRLQQVDAVLVTAWKQHKNRNEFIILDSQYDNNS